MATGGIPMQPITKTIATFLRREHLQKLQLMGYTFKEMLGEGGFGAAFRCKFTYVDPQTRTINVKPYCAKVVRIHYMPDLRPRTPEETRQLQQYEKLKLNYKMHGKRVNESVMWRKVDTQVASDLIEFPMLSCHKVMLRRNTDYIESELKAMISADHENVVKLENIIRFYDNYSTNPFMTSVVIFMELADGGDLNRYLFGKRLSEDECKQMMAQIACGVEHLHTIGIAHMDLKPENILLFKDQQQNMVLKITDFGLSILFDTGSPPTATDARGTPLYRCPTMVKQELEVRNGVRKEMRYDPTKADMWSMGLITLFIIYGYGMLRWAYDQVQPGQSYSNSFLRLLSTLQKTPLFEHLMKQLLVDEQDIRISIIQFCEHKWMHDAVVANKRGIIVTRL